MDNAPRSPSAVDSAIVIALLTAAAYAIAFAYERGYVSAFGLPSQLIEIDLKSILIGGAGLMGVVFVLSLLELLLALRPASWPEEIQNRFNKRLVQPMIVAILLALLGPNPRIWITIAMWLVVGFLVTLNFVGARSEMKKYRQRGDEYLREIDAIDRTRRNVPLERLEARFGPRASRALIIFLLGLWAANIIGVGHAQHETTFLMPEEAPACIVIRRYHGELVCVGIDALTQNLTGDFRFISIGSTAEEFQLKEVGPFTRLKSSR